jgi:hypothetical protein
MYTWRSRPHSSWSSLSADSVQLARQRSVKATLVPSEYARERHELIEFLSLLGDPLLRLAPLVVQPAQVVLAPARLHAIERVSLQQRVEATGTLLERLTGKIDDAWARAVDRVVIGVLRPDLVLDPPKRLRPANRAQYLGHRLLDGPGGAIEPIELTPLPARAPSAPRGSGAPAGLVR